MHPRFRSPAIVGVLIASLATVIACGPGASAPSPSASSGPNGSPGASGDAELFPNIISGELIEGENRIIFTFQAANGQPVATPDRTASVTFTGPGGETVTGSDPEFVWSIEDVVGLYVTRATFPVAGDWMASFTTAAPDSPEQTIPFSFQVKTDASVVWPGEDAPSVDTPTLADVGGDVAKISSDADPDPAFYETSVADALAAKEPFVLVFATPKFCQTKTCGPTLEKIKAVAADHPDVTFINVEPYLLKDVGGQLQPDLSADGNLQAAPATTAYGLIVEPFVFVVDKDGVVTDSYELIFTTDEIDAALDALS
jgi:hypothetical protein